MNRKYYSVRYVYEFGVLAESEKDAIDIGRAVIENIASADPLDFRVYETLNQSDAIKRGAVNYDDCPD